MLNVMVDSVTFGPCLVVILGILNTSDGVAV